MKQNKINTSKKKFENNKNGEINLIKNHLKSSADKNEKTKIINYIKKKITFQSFSSKFIRANSNNNILNNNNTKNIIVRNFTNRNKINSTGNSLTKNKKDKKIDIYTDKIVLKNKKTFINKKKFFSSKLSFSLDNILSKTLNKNTKNKKQKSFEKNKSKYLTDKKKNILKNNLKTNNTQRNIFNKKLNVQEKSKKIFSNKIQYSKKNLDKNQKFYRNFIHRKGKVILNNITEVKNHINKINILNNNPINGKNKKKNNFNNNKKINYSSKNNLYKEKKDYINNTMEISDIISDEYGSSFNNPKLLGENNSTNDKSLNNKKEENKTKKIITPKIIMNKIKNYGKNKVHNNLIKDNNSYNINEFDTGNEEINKINGVKINNFNIKKPKEENLKFTFMKNDKESEVSYSHASKIIIGNIDGYKDIIETDIKNNKKKFSKCFNNLIMKKSNLFNQINANKLDKESLEFSMIGEKKKFSGLSTLIKKESEHINFKEYNFYDSFNITNNLDGISSTITNNILNENKGENINMNFNNKNNDSIKIYNGIDFNKASFINTEKSIEDFSKFVNYSIIKGNNNENLTNNNNDGIKLKYNNKNVYKEYKSKKKEKNDFINNNCKIF